MARKKSGESPAKPRQTTKNHEGFFEPFNSEEVPWERLPGSTAFKFILKGGATLVLDDSKYVMNHTKENCVFMTIRDNKSEDIACFPNSGNARIRATGKMVPISEV